MIAELICSASYTFGFLIGAIMTIISMLVLSDNERFRAIMILFAVLLLSYFIGLSIQGSAVYLIGV